MNKKFAIKDLPHPEIVYGQDTCFPKDKHCPYLKVDAQHGLALSCGRYSTPELKTVLIRHIYGYQFQPTLRSKECLLYELSILELHTKAMELYQTGLVIESKDADIEQAITQFREASLYEKIAADKTACKKDCEPSRSILYRSAASLYYKAGEYLKALDIIELCLDGDPSVQTIEECEELKNLINTIEVKI